MRRSTEWCRRVERTGARIRRAQVVGLMAAVALGLVAPALPAQEASQVDVHILIYSGRPDPVLALEPSDELLTRVREILGSAPEATGFEGETVLPSILGYKGVRIANPSGAAGLPRHVALYRGVVETRDGGSVAFLTDAGRELESALLRRAVEEGLVPVALLESEKIPPREEPEVVEEDAGLTPSS